MTGPAATPSAPVRVAIADLHRDSRFQIRHRMEPATVDRYAKALAAGRSFPPVRAALVGGVLVLVDGWHRLAAHQAIGATHVEATITEASAEEARWLAAEANLAHGLPLKTRELPDAFRAFVKAGRYRATDRPGGRPRLLSYREIAKALGPVAHTTVRNWMQKDFPKIAKEYGGEAGLLEGPPPREDPEDHFAKAARDLIRQAVTAARGVRDPDRRGAIIGAAEEALRELRDGGAWKLPLPEEF